MGMSNLIEIEKRSFDFTLLPVAEFTRYGGNLKSIIYMEEMSDALT